MHRDWQHPSNATRWRSKGETPAVSCLMRCGAFCWLKRLGQMSPNDLWTQKHAWHQKFCESFLKEAWPSLSTSLPYLCTTCGKLIDILRAASTQCLSKSFHYFSLHNLWSLAAMSMPCAEKGMETLWFQSQQRIRQSFLTANRHIETCLLVRLALSQCRAVTSCCHEHIHI